MSRRLLLLLLYMTLFLAVAIGGIWAYNEYQSRKEMESLRALAQDADTGGVAMSETDIARFTHLDKDRASAAKSTGEPVKEILPQLKALYARNNDLAGWLTIPDTDIDYPVMYLSDDNDFYLKHNFDKEDDVNGLLVLDKRCRSDGSGINNLIHGHNMKSGAMFGSLKYYQQPDYYREHPIVTFSTLYVEKRYEIFAIFKSSVYNEVTSDFQYFNYIDIETEEEFNTYVRSAKEQSLFDTGVDAAWGDELITLSTCEYTKENGRLVIVAKEIK